MSSVYSIHAKRTTERVKGWLSGTTGEVAKGYLLGFVLAYCALILTRALLMLILMGL